MSNNDPIGIFDSGIGGLSVLQEIQKILPSENLLYVADSKYAPYGEQSVEFIKQRSLTICDFLIRHEAKAIVVACNTATACAIDDLRGNFSIPIVAMEPGVKPAALLSDTNVIGILATVGTLKSDKYLKLSSEYTGETRVISQPCPGLVEQIEQGDVASDITRELLEKFIEPLIEQDVDQLVLGCTHYPLVKSLIKKIVGKDINVIDTGSAVAKQLITILEEHELKTDNKVSGVLSLWSSLDSDKMTQTVGQLFGLTTKVKMLDEKKLLVRCAWADASKIERDYHDEEWGMPVHDDRLLFEFLILEGAQAGLSWSTVLNKRAGYKEAFDNFEAKKVAKYTKAKISKLLLNPEIIRNRLKVNSTITNAKAFLEVQKEFGSFDKYVWQFVGGKTIRNTWQDITEIPTSTQESDKMSKDLKQRGFKFVGTTICYAFMQAVGMVNDHTQDCFRYDTIAGEN